jgi:nucleoside-diphosphate-sugar epimerase
MPTLVTGGTGFLGCYVLESLLKAGEEVVCLSNTPLSRPLRVQGELEMIEADIGDMNKMVEIMEKRGVARVIHLAGLVSSLAQKSPRLATVVNCGGIANVLEAARLAGAKRVVFSSSVQVYGPSASSDRGIDEEFPCDPTTVYGATKLFGEKLGINYYQMYGLQFVSVRMSACYGYCNIVSKKELSGNRVEQVQKIVEYPLAGRQVVIRGTGTDLMDYVYVEDAAETIASAALKDGLTHHAYLVSSGELHTMGDFARLVRKEVPGASISFEGASDKALFPQLGPFDTSRARSELGHHPRPFEENVERYIAVARAAT